MKSVPQMFRQMHEIEEREEKKKSNNHNRSTDNIIHDCVITSEL